MKPLTSHFRLPPAEFTFASFSFPRWKATLPRGDKKKRIQYHKQPVCGPYYHAPKPNQTGGYGFYLGDTSSPFSLRWQYCDEVEGTRINHTGWWADEYQDDKFRGLVFRLPRSRGFLAGWTMGEGMASAIECVDIYETSTEAAYAADSLAESQADTEREYREKQEAEREAEEERETAEDLESALCSAD